MIGMAISAAPELLGALHTTLGLEDLYDLIEVMQVDRHNDRTLQRILDKE